MKTKDLTVGTTYIGPRHRVTGRQERRRLLNLGRPYGSSVGAIMAAFVDLDRDVTRRVTAKSFAGLAVRAVGLADAPPVVPDLLNARLAAAEAVVGAYIRGERLAMRGLLEVWSRAKEAHEPLGIGGADGR